MVKLTKLDGHVCWINPDHIVQMEANPDTMLLLDNGSKVLVREGIDTILTSILESRCSS